MVSNKKWSIGLLVVVIIMLVGLGGITVLIDPYFHYHAPLSFLEYPLNNQRYQNDGIVKHFEYNAIITGTSMTENFKTSEFDEIFGVNSIKVPFSGGSYKEINENLERAMEANLDIKIILRGLDYNRLQENKDAMKDEMEMYPLYLYDDLWYNDVNYIFNKSVLLGATWDVLVYTENGFTTPTFDAYSSWREKEFGKDVVDNAYTRPEKVDEELNLDGEAIESIRENIMQNVIELAERYPQVDFYLFFTPYSIYYWDQLNQTGRLVKQLEAEKEVIKILVNYKNIFLFSFFDEFDMICNLDNYKDAGHYSGDVNSQILLWMYNKEHLLTKENYQEYCDKIYEFYTAYDYDSLFMGNGEGEK